MGQNNLEEKLRQVKSRMTRKASLYLVNVLFSIQQFLYAKISSGATYHSEMIYFVAVNYKKSVDFDCSGTMSQ